MLRKLFSAFALSAFALAMLLPLPAPASAGETGGNARAPFRLYALGDSLTAGYGVAPAEAFPVQLQAALKAKGYNNVVVENAGVSGDTATQGLMRLDWSVPPAANAVIVELGANDMLRGQPPAMTRAALEQIITRLKARNLPVLLSGMQAAPNLGREYRAEFDAIYPALAAEHGVLLHPFFLEGVAGHAARNQPDGLHPNAEGVKVIVASILPHVEDLLQQAGVQKSTPAAPAGQE